MSLTNNTLPKVYITVLALLSMFITSCSLFEQEMVESEEEPSSEETPPPFFEKQDDPGSSELGGNLLFQSGFEDGVSLTGNKEDLRGSDGMDWTSDLESGIPEVRKFFFNFVDGVHGRDLKVELRQDPENKDNRVLYFENIQSVVSGKTSRVQSELLFQEYNNVFSQGYVRYRMRFSENIDHLRQYSGEIGWFTIMEWWENVDSRLSGDPAGKSRVALHINKKAGKGQKLFWRIYSEKRQPYNERGDKLFNEINNSVEVPVGEWFTLETFFRQGDKNKGLVQVAITTESGDRKVLFNIKGATQHPSAPQPMRSWQFFKLYTSRELLKFMKDAGKPAAVYYDDIMIRTGGFEGS